MPPWCPQSPDRGHLFVAGSAAGVLMPWARGPTLIPSRAYGPPSARSKAARAVGRARLVPGGEGAASRSRVLSRVDRGPGLGVSWNCGPPAEGYRSGKGALCTTRSMWA
jgi:hypothetical protein